MTAPPATPRPGWLLDELRSAGRENLDPDHVAGYDARMDGAALDEVALLRGLGLSGQSVLVDLGAGTGQLTLAAAPVARRVVAVDVSPVMLGRLRARVDRSGLTNVDVVHAGFLTYRHEGDPADVVYSRYALHHLPDFWKAVALARIRGMLRPGGLLRVVDVVWRAEPAAATEHVEAWCATAGTAAAADWTRAELEEHVRDEHSTFTWLLEPMFERCGFTIEQAAYADDRAEAAYVLRAG